MEQGFTDFHMLQSSFEVFRSAGATIRIYIESVINSGDQRLCHSAKELLKPLVLIALDICKIAQFTGRENPTVIT